MSLQALLAWYQDVLAEPASSNCKVSPPKPPATPFGKLQLTTPMKTTRSAAAVAAATTHISPTASVTSPLAKLGMNTPKGKGGAAPPQAQQARCKAMSCLYQASSPEGWSPTLSFLVSDLVAAISGCL